MTRNVKDAEGRSWQCTPDASSPSKLGQDVKLVCTSSAMPPVQITVSWQWAKMSEKGLARMINEALRPAA